MPGTITGNHGKICVKYTDEHGVRHTYSQCTTGLQFTDAQCAAMMDALSGALASYPTVERYCTEQTRVKRGRPPKAIGVVRSIESEAHSG